jgi:hypothetical protein
MQKAAAMSTVSWISTSVAPSARAAATSSCRHQLAALLDLAGNRKQRAELQGHAGIPPALRHRIHEGVVAAVVVRGRGAVTQIAESAVVARRHERRDRFAFRARERAGPAQERLGQGAQMDGGFGPERHRARNAWKVGGKGDVGHGRV